MPYHIFEPRYRQMIEDAVEQEALISVVPIQSAGIYESKICYAGVPQILHRYEDGRMDISLLGEVRCRLKKFIKEDPYIVYGCEQEFDEIYLSSKTNMAQEFMFEMLMGWAHKHLPQPEQRAAFKMMLKDKEALLSYATMFLISDNKLREEIVELKEGDERANMILKAVGPKDISLGPFLPPIRWR